MPAARSVSNGHSNKGDNSDAFRIRGPTPEQLERAWLEQAVEHSTGTFLQPYKAPEQQRSSKVFVFVRHGHSTWNEQSRIQASGQPLSAPTDTAMHSSSGAGWDAF